MNRTQQTCDTQRIDDYLASDLSEELQLELELHLSNCELCRQQIERRAAEPDVWNHAAQLLGQSSMNGLPKADFVASMNSAQNNAWDQPTRDSQGDVAGIHRQAASVLDSLAPTDDPDMLGRIGEYEISGIVGVGGMGAVLKGFDKSLRRVVAVKVMAPHLAGSGSARARFQREARAAAAITHDNVIDIYAVSETSGLPYLVMPYARGPSLQKRIDEGGPLAVIEVVRIGRQIASGLAAAHEQGLVHRDIKPANILLSDGIERLWITDFGVARAMDDASMTQTGLIAGTPQYMSPEQARGETVDHRSDLFSLGSVLYTACTGRPPFRSEAAYGILRRITDTDPRPVREINSDIPEWMCVIIDRLLAKHPADRFESAEEVAELLDGCLAHLQQPLQVDLPQSVLLRRDGSGAHAEPITDSHAASSKPNPSALLQPQLRRPFFTRRGLVMIGSLLLAAVLGVAATQLTNPADISGQWTGENWQHVALSSVDEASDWYSGSFTDAAGRRGALRLEWSRLQRRYNGRWKVGEAESGEITLRVGKDGALRGAVSVDPESEVDFDVPRLREFAWQPASEETQRELAMATPAGNKRGTTVGGNAAGNVAGKSLVIHSPVKGTIVRVPEKIKVNTTVKKGDVIIELAPPEQLSATQRQELLSASERKVQKAFDNIIACENDLEAAHEIVVAIRAKLQNIEAANKLILRATEQEVLSTKSILQAQENEVADQEAKLAQARTELAEANESTSQGTSSKLELQQAERKVASQEAKFEKAKAAVSETQSLLSHKEQALEAKRLETLAKLDVAVVELKRAEAEVVRLMSETEVAQADFENERSAEQELRDRLDEVQRIQIRAPEDGLITRFLHNFSAVGTVKEGDFICELKLNAPPESPTPTQPDSIASQSQSPAAAAPATQLAPIQSLSVFGPASELVERVRLAQKAIENSASSTEKSNLSVVKLRKEIEEWRQKQSQPDFQDAASKEQLSIRIAALETNLKTIENSLNNDAAAKQLAETLLAEALAERDTIIAILITQLRAAERRLEFHQSSRSITKKASDAGLVNLEELSKAEQLLASAQSELEQLKLLLDFYSKIGVGDAEAENDSQR